MSARWLRVALGGALIAGVAVFARDVSPVRAQPASALGQPLADPALEARTVTVRVIAGDRDKPVTGVDVTLAIIPPDGSPASERVARTDAEGRAAFVDLPSGSVVTAKVAGPGGEQSSIGFAVPATGGTKVLLSTVPMDGATTTAPGTGPAGQGPPQPRMMSGRARPQRGDAADTLTVRLTYDDLVDPRPPQDHPVVLVAYRYDHTVTTKVAKTDGAGRAVFTGLDRTGATSYFAMATLGRGAVHDRLTSGPIQMIADDGLRLMLSGEQRDAAKPAVDDFGTLAPQPTEPVPAGTVEVVLTGVPEDGAPLELIDASTGQVMASAPSGPPLVAGGTTEATWTPAAAAPALANGTVEVTVTLDGRPGPPLAVEVRRRAPAAMVDKQPTVLPAPAAIPGVTDASGRATISGLDPGETVDVVVVTPAGASSPTPVTLPATGGAKVAASVTWKERGQGGATLTGAIPLDDHAYYVRARMHGQRYLSAPFQVTPTRGAQVNVVAMPRVMLSFSLTSWVDDQFLAVSGQWSISNSSWAPYLATKGDRPTELVVPVPRAATGLQVRDDFAAVVGTDPSRGLIIRRPLPPGGLEFFAGFSMKIHGGKARWDLPLPLGSFESGIELLRPNHRALIVLPPGTKGANGKPFEPEDASDKRGSFWVLSPITILPPRAIPFPSETIAEPEAWNWWSPPQRMVFDVTGLPEPDGWNFWAKVGVGAAVLVILLGGLVFALQRSAAVAARDSTRARYDRLLDELARLEDGDGDPVRKTELLAELEGLRERLDQADPAPEA